MGGDSVSPGGRAAPLIGRVGGRGRPEWFG